MGLYRDIVQLQSQRINLNLFQFPLLDTSGLNLAALKGELGTNKDFKIVSE